MKDDQLIGVHGTFANGYAVRKVHSFKVESFLITRRSEVHAKARALRLTETTGDKYLINRVPIFVDLAIAKQMVEDHHPDESAGINAKPESLAALTCATGLLATIVNIPNPNRVWKLVQARHKELDEQVIPALTDLLVNTVGLTTASDLYRAVIARYIEQSQ